MDFLPAILGVDGRGIIPSSVTPCRSFSLPEAAAHSCGMPVFRVVLPTFFIDRKAWLARARNVFDFFMDVLDFSSPGVFESFSFLRTFTTSTTSRSASIMLRFSCLSLSPLRLGMTIVSCDSFPAR